MRRDNHPKRDPLLIGLCGYAGAGKDTVGDYLCDHHGFERYAFADPIRNMLEALLADADVDYAHLFERSMKELDIPALGISARKLMQTLGTEWGRQTLHPDFWLRIAERALGLDGWPNSAPVHDRIVITDVRFPNEAAWVERHRGFIVRIDRPVLSVRFHESECFVHRIKPWSVLSNAGPLAEMHAQLDALVPELEAHP